MINRALLGAIPTLARRVGRPGTLDPPGEGRRSLVARAYHLNRIERTARPPD